MQFICERGRIILFKLSLILNKGGHIVTQFLQQIKPNGGEATFPEMWPNTTVPNDFVMNLIDYNYFSYLS